MADFFKTVAERPELTLCQVSGIPPQWLQGSLLRVGPGRYEYGQSSYKHAFDGDAIIHAFKIKDGEVWFHSKFLRSNSYVKSDEAGEIKGVGYGGIPPTQSLEKDMHSKLIPIGESDNCNDVITTIQGRTSLATDSPFLWAIDSESLDSVQRLDVRALISSSDLRSWAAHNHIGDDGTYYNVSTEFSSSKIQFIAIPSTADQDASNDALQTGKISNASILAEIPIKDDRFPYHHSFAMTENFIVFFKLPYFLRKEDLESSFHSLGKQSFLDMFSWDSSSSTVAYVISRANGCIVGAYVLSPCFIFHHGNAFETNAKIIVDVCCYESNEIIVEHDFSNLKKSSPSQTADLRRYEFPKPSALDCKTTLEASDYGVKDLGTTSNKEFEILHQNFEVPAINYQKFNGKPYKFIYGSDGQNVIKVNVDTKEKNFWSELDCVPGEPTFVEAPDAVEEDDGVIMLSVIGINGKPSFMLILNAKDLNEVCRATIVGRLPVSFHGVFKWQ